MPGSSARSWAATCLTIAVLIVLLTGTLPGAKALACPADAKAKADALYKEANDLYNDRLDHPDNPRAALAKSEEAVKLCPDHAAAWAFVAALDWALGEALPKQTKADKQKRIEWFTKGEAAADTAMKADPNNADAIYWKASNMAAAADMKGWASSVWMLPSLIKYMDTIDKKDPHYGYGATKRFWAEVMSRVPLSLSDKFGYDPHKDVVDPLEAEIKREPRYLPNYIFVARALHTMGKPEDKQNALDHLRAAITGDPNALPDQKPDNAAYQRIARELWKEWTGKDYPNQ
jgi:hypothetical protein